MAFVRGVIAASTRSDVDEHRPRPLEEDAVRRGDEAERRCDDLVTLAKAEAAHQNVERARSAVDGHGVTHADVGSDRLLEGGELRAERQAIALQHLDDGGNISFRDLVAGERNRHGVNPPR